MDRTDFQKGFDRLVDRFPRKFTAAEVEQYWESINGWSNASWLAVVDRACADCRQFPEVVVLRTILRDLTYWDHMDFTVHWDEAFWETTGVSYWCLDPEDPLYAVRKKEHEEILSRRDQIQNWARRLGGVRAVQHLLKDHAARGYLANMTCLDFLNGKLPQHQEDEAEESAHAALGYGR